MIGSDVMLFPETGPEFLRCLKTAALFSDHVFTLSAFVDELVIAVMPNVGNTGTRTEALFRAIQRHRADFDLLKHEGIMADLSQRQKAESEVHAGERLKRIVVANLISDQNVRSGNVPATALCSTQSHRAFRLCPPSTWGVAADLFRALEQDAIESGELSKALSLPTPVLEKIAFDMYLQFIVATAERYGMAILTYAPLFQAALREALENRFLAEEDELATSRRREVQARVAYTILDRRLPKSDDLPLPEILELRRKHCDEIRAFRVGLGEIAAQVDAAQDPNKITAEIEVLIATKVDPALHDLRAAMKESRLEALKRIGQSWESVAAATVPLVMTYGTGAPADVKVILSVISSIIGPLLGGEVERRKLLNGSKWSLLLKLDGLSG